MLKMESVSSKDLLLPSTVIEMQTSDERLTLSCAVLTTLHTHRPGGYAAKHKLILVSTAGRAITFANAAVCPGAEHSPAKKQDEGMLFYAMNSGLNCPVNENLRRPDVALEDYLMTAPMPPHES